MSYRMTKAQLELTKAGDCTRCGNFANDRNTAGQCGECHNLQYAERKAARKAELATTPRCECCTRRGTWNVAGVLLCGIHKKQAQGGFYRSQGNMPWLPMPMDRESILKWAQS